MGSRESSIVKKWECRVYSRIVFRIIFFKIEMGRGIRNINLYNFREGWFLFSSI